MAAGLYDITNEILGKGHFAVVKLAKHCLTGEAVAIKIIDKVKLAKDALGQLRHEIRLWSILSEHEHPNVVKLYQCIDTRSKLYLVMEYCGRNVCDLFDHIQRRNSGNGLPETEARHIFFQVCSAIHYCHSLRIVHRDLKPENILIIADSSAGFDAPKVKICDFGFSNQWARDSILLRTSCGSLAYSAPEILLGNRYNAPMIDIWALGCILYILVYGTNPFMQFTDSETLIKILDCSFDTPSRDSISNEVILLIRGLLRKVPEERLNIEQVMNNRWLNSGNSSNDKTSDTSPVQQAVSSDDQKNKNSDNKADEETLQSHITVKDAETKCKTNDSDSDKICDTKIKNCDRNDGDEQNNSTISLNEHNNDSAPQSSANREYCKTKEVVNDQIIDSMISRGINLSKDAIRRILMEDSKQEHESSNHELEKEKCAISPNLHSSTTGNVHKSPEVNHFQYVRATYQLLKDKNARETLPNSVSDADLNENCLQNIQASEEHERSSRMFNAKRGKLGVRKTLLGNGNSNGLSLTGLGFRQPLSSRLPELAPLPETTSGMTGLFALPLARKCSVVSEEGLTTEGNTPEPPVCNLSSGEDALSSKDDAWGDVSVIGGSTISVQAPSLLITDTTENGFLHEKPRFNVLHPVSSSPDFLVATHFEEDEEEEENQSSDMRLPDSTKTDLNMPRSCLANTDSVSKKDNHEPVKTSGESIFEHYQRKQPLALTNVRVSKNRIIDQQSNNCSSKTPTPSVRVIIQSKSLNNIALNDAANKQDSPQANGLSGSTALKAKTNNSSGDVKLVNSMSAASIGKMVRTDKADCCCIT